MSLIVSATPLCAREFLIRSFFYHNTVMVLSFVRLKVFKLSMHSLFLLDTELQHHISCIYDLVMGTDTMAYTATALSFMLENLSKPVVFTGSQVPIAQPHSDARRNLVMALIFASRYPPINEVTIYFHDRLIR